MGFSRQKYWRGMPSPSPGDVSDPGIEPHLLRLFHWQAGFLLPVQPGDPFLLKLRYRMGAGVA